MRIALALGPIALAMGLLIGGLSAPAWAGHGVPFRHVGRLALRHALPHVHHHHFRPRYIYRPYHYGFHHHYGPRYFSFYRSYSFYRPYGFGFSFGYPYYSVPYYSVPYYSVRSYSIPFCAVSSPYPVDAPDPLPPPNDAGTSFRDTVLAHRTARAPDWGLLHRPADRSFPASTRVAAAPRMSERRDATFISTGQREQDHVSLGDKLFVAQVYSAALAQYDAAASAEPRSTAAQLRRGYALVALDRTGEAAAAFRKALATGSFDIESTFHPHQLYDADTVRQTRHIERMAGKALANPGDRDVLFVIGALLQLEGQPERAKLFFRRAADAALEEPLVLVGDQ